MVTGAVIRRRIRPVAVLRSGKTPRCKNYQSGSYRSKALMPKVAEIKGRRRRRVGAATDGQYVDVKRRAGGAVRRDFLMTLSTMRRQIVVGSVMCL